MNLMSEPCMSCGDDRSGPPRADEAGRCKKPTDHRSPQPHQVWAWIDGRWQTRGTGVEYLNRPGRMTGP